MYHSYSNEYAFEDLAIDSVQNEDTSQLLKMKQELSINDETCETIIKSVNEISNEWQPVGHVVKINDSPQSKKQIVVTLKTVDKQLFSSKHLKLLQKNKRAIGIYAVAVGNKKLPWMQITKVPDEYMRDLKQRRNIENRYYLSTIQSMCSESFRPSCQIICSIGEAGDIETERQRLIKQFELYPESFEEGNAGVYESLKSFLREIDL